MKTKRSYGLNIGASSILVIIVILCLICFGGLSMASSNADYLLSKKLAARTTAYYNACNQAQYQLKDISAQLASLYQASSSASDYEQKIKESLSDSLNLSYIINDNQTLEVSILPLFPESVSGPFYEITSWKVTNISIPELDTSLPVLLGN